MPARLNELLTALVALLLLLVPRAAHASRLPHFDLDSLAYDSAAVVLVTKVGERKLDAYRTATTVRVERVYGVGGSPRGQASEPTTRPVGDASSPARIPSAGEEIELDFGDYSFEPLGGWSPPGAPRVAPEMVVFLERNAAGEAGLRWGIVASGLRIFANDRVQRFQQQSNPGLYGPTPGEGPAGNPFDRAAFEVAVARALGRAGEVRSALDEPPSSARAARLVELAALPLIAGVEGLDVGEDRVGRAIVLALGRERNIDAMLDAKARAPRIATFGLDHRVPVERLGAVALDRASPLRRRTASLSLLEGAWFELSESAGLGARLATLLDDPDPVIRMAALGLSFPRDQVPKAYTDAMLRRFKVETDPRVRLQIYERGGAYQLQWVFDTKGIEMPLVVAEQAKGALTVRWAGVDERVGYYPERLVVEVRSKRVGAPPRRADLTTAGASSSASSVTVPLTFDPPLEPGAYEVDVDLAVKNSVTNRVAFTRKLTMGTQQLVAPPPPSPGAPASAPAAASASAPAAASLPSASGSAAPSTSSAPPASTPAKARGCGCVVGAAEGPRVGHGAIAAAAVAAAFARRRARRGARPA
jgi:hypothetical protein